DSPLVKLAVEATKLLGVEPRLDLSSTDSNLPISLGIPAITLGAGGTAGASHTLAEWYDPRDRDKGLKRALLVILALAGRVDLNSQEGGNVPAMVSAGALPPS